ncbi:MAG: cytidylate kinase-like family protein [Deltaproteobacteria bacterium]|nr:cytidylate kinase-like family protein [Deltaproteobacteria bacterium]
MSIVTISRGSFSRGKEVAEKVADCLGYRCVSRDLILRASKEFNVPELSLVKAVRDGPGFFDHFTHSKDRYISYFQYALLKEFQKDDVVYHGFAGQFLAKGFHHVLKVRIIADWGDRLQLLMAREGIERADAVRALRRLDEERRKWSEGMYGLDVADPSLYDLVIHIHRLTVDEASDIICRTAKLDRFKTTPESQAELDQQIFTSRQLVGDL